MKRWPVTECLHEDIDRVMVMTEHGPRTAQEICNECEGVRINGVWTQ